MESTTRPLLNGRPIKSIMGSKQRGEGVIPRRNIAIKLHKIFLFLLIVANFGDGKQGILEA